MRYWDWCIENYLRQPESDSERFAFWELLPSSGRLFPEAIKRALQASPNQINNAYFFMENLQKSELSISYPAEFVELLLALVRADTHLPWYQEKWQEIWNTVKDTDSRGLDLLRDALAQKGIL